MPLVEVVRHEAVYPSLEEQGLLSLEAISIKLNIQIIFFNQWSFQISTPVDWALALKMSVSATQIWVYWRLPT